MSAMGAVTRHESAWARFRRWARLEGLFAHVLMMLLLFALLIPLTWLVGTSFKDIHEYAENSAGLFPRWGRWSLINYQFIFSQIGNFPIYMRNSFVLAFGVVGIQVFVSSLAGYAFARLQFRFRDVIFFAMLVSIFIPRSGGLMALYELMSWLRLRNKLIGLILLFSAGVPTSIFIMRQSFLAVPRDIEESALIDGAGWFQVFWRIALPIASGGMIVIATLSFIGVWSDYLVTFTMIDKDTQMTMSVGIRKLLRMAYDMALSPLFRGKFAGEASDTALLLLAALPVIVFYAALQRWFMRGLTEGAVKF
ncbi:MAG: carbohydrate ABC transporter permease [Chloroflexi bacterium]|nr:carbohydrate ABC transporter permease [Chloroflexota bacterium]